MTIIPQIALTENTPTAWYGCYDGGWGDNITSLSYSHPAKISRGLSIRIYSYALERGWLKIGDTVLDPFGGIGGTCLDALANGLNWIGCELERRFCDLGQGCECTGISKADWIRFYGRWDKVAHTGERYWCPQCLAEAKQVTTSRQLSFFEPDPTAAYTRNSGIIPSTEPHYYRGNLDLFRKYAKPGTWAVLLNGDSRNLRAVIGQAQVDGLLSSPPFENSMESWDKNAHIDWSKTFDGKNHQGKGQGSQGTRSESYGQTTGQLGIEQGTTFWAAAKAIVTESYLALKPGSYAFFVCKAFVRDGKRVDFPGQWQQLCEAVGFEYVETIRAMLVSQENEQKDLNGGGKKIRKEKKSFFRRLAEKNGSPRIDFEEVVILRKPGAYSNHYPNPLEVAA